MVLVISVFTILHLAGYGMNRLFLKELSSVYHLNHFFDFYVSFTGSVKISDDVPDANHNTSWLGRHGETSSRQPCRRTADRLEKADFTAFAVHCLKNIIYVRPHP